MSDVTTGWTSDPEESWSNGWDEAERHVRETEVKPLAQRHSALVAVAQDFIKAAAERRRDGMSPGKLAEFVARFELLASEPVTP